MLGWRWAYGGWAVVALVAVLVPPPGLEATVPRRLGGRLREGDVPLATMSLLAVAAALGAAVGTSLASFSVSSAVDAVVTPGTAGAVLTAASIVGMGARVLIGLVADRLERGHFRLVLQLAGLGSLGYLGLAVAGSLSLLTGASFVAFAAGWGWPGLFNFAVVRWNRNAPGVATAITQAGVFAGGVVGPAGLRGGDTVDICCRVEWRRRPQRAQCRVRSAGPTRPGRGAAPESVPSCDRRYCGARPQ